MKGLILLTVVLAGTHGMKVNLEEGQTYTLESSNYPNEYPVDSKTVDTFKYKLPAEHLFRMVCPRIDVPCANDDNIEFKREGDITLEFCSNQAAGSGFVSRSFVTGPHPDKQSIVIKLRTEKNDNPGNGFSCTITVQDVSEDDDDDDDDDNNGGGGGGSGGGDNDAAINSNICGTTSSTKIVGGSDVDIRSYPFSVWVLSDGGSCSGSLLTNRWILTAAHCTDRSIPSRIRAYIGCTSISPRNCLFDGVPMSQKFEAPGWNGNVIDGDDVAVLRLSSPVTFSSRVRPVCLSSASISPGDSLVITGFGRDNPDGGSITDILKAGTVTAISDQACANVFGGSRFVSGEIVCTVRGNANTCGGDSGGFLGRRINNKYTILGITSFGATRCATGAPDGFAQISSFVNFITSTVNANP